MIRREIDPSTRNTPLVLLRGSTIAPPRASLYAKLELDQAGQMKHRVARYLLDYALQSGEIEPGGTIIESSSGTMAEGWARVGSALGYRVIIVANKKAIAPIENKLLALGAELRFANRRATEGGWQASRLKRLIQELQVEPDAYWPRQYDNPQVPAAYAEVAEEIIAAVGRVDIFVSSIGSGSSLCGTARVLKEHNPELHVVAVDTVGSVQFHQDYKSRLQSGHGNDIIAGNIDYGLIDEVHWVNDGEAFHACRELARREGIFAGGSSGASYLVASWMAQQAHAGANVITIFPDRGDRYLQTIYDDAFLSRKGLEEMTTATAPVTIDYGQAQAERWSRATLPHGGPMPYYRAGTPTSKELTARFEKLYPRSIRR